MPSVSSPSDRPGVGPVRPVRPVGRHAHLLALALTAVAVPAAAQPVPPPGGGQARVDNARGAALTARYHVRQMENVLERALAFAADGVALPSFGAWGETARWPPKRPTDALKTARKLHEPR